MFILPLMIIEDVILYDYIIYYNLHHIWQELIGRWDTRTWRDVSSYMTTYLPLNYDTPVLPEYFLSNAYLLGCYISNGRRFTKSVLRILLISTFRVSSIKYSLVCSPPIHTRSSANAEGPRAHCQLKSCKMLHKCSTDCIWKGLQSVNDLSRSFEVTALAAIYNFPLVFHCKCISVLHLDHAYVGTVCHRKTNTPRVDACTKFHDFMFSHSRKN